MIDEAVVYNVGGDARQDSHGISIFMQVEEYEANAPYLKYIVGKWISVLTSTRQSLARDYSPPDISLSVRKDNTLFGKIEGIDLDYVSTFVTQDVEDNRFRLKILSIVDEEAEDFVKPNDLGFMSYNWSRQIMSLCNGGEQDCKPTSMTFEKNGRTKFAYTQARLESDRYNGTLWLIYIASDNNSRFEFLGGWPGVDDNGNAIRELVPLVEGDHVYALSYLIRYDPTADESFFEQIEDPDPITIAEGFGPAGHIYPGEYNLIISACDFSDNCGYSDYFPYTVE